MKRYVLALLMILVPCVSEATDYYVRPHVTDAACTYGACNGTSYENAWEGFTGGDGTPVNWTTVDGSAGVANTLYVCGTHNEQIAITAGGESDAYITIKSYPSDPGIVDLNNGDSGSYAVGSSNNYIIIDGLEIRECNNHGIRFTGTTGSCEVKNCIIHNNGIAGETTEDGIRIGAGSNYLIHDNTIYENGKSGVSVYPSTGSVSDVSIYNNVIYDNYHSNVDVQGVDSGDRTSTNISIYRNHIYDTSGHSDPTGCTSIYMDGPTDALSKVDGIDIYYNIIHDGNGEGILVQGYSYNIDIYNNTIVDGLGNAIDLDQSDTTTVNIKNNILSGYVDYGIDDDGASDPTATNNLIYDCTGGTVHGFTHGAGLVTGDPLFVSAGSDFRLQAGSPARDAGENLGATYDDALSPADSTFPYDTVDQDSYGSGWEIGAFAHTGYIGGTAMSYTGSAITGTGNEAYVKCYATTGTGNDIRPDDNAPVATDTTDTTTGKYDLFGVTIGSLYFCTFSFYDTTPIAGAQFITAQ